MLKLNNPNSIFKLKGIFCLILPIIFLIISCKIRDVDQICNTEIKEIQASWTKFISQNEFNNVKDSATVWAEKFWNISQVFPQSIYTDSAIIKTFEILFLYDKLDSLGSKFSRISIEEDVYAQLVKYLPTISSGSWEDQFILLQEQKDMSGNRLVKASCLYQSILLAQSIPMPLIINELYDSLIINYLNESNKLGLLIDTVRNVGLTISNKSTNANISEAKDYNDGRQRVYGPVEYMVTEFANVTNAQNQYNFRTLISDIYRGAKKPGVKELIEILENGPGNCGLLYYHFDNDKLKIWLFSKSGFFGFCETNVSSEEILEASNSLRRSMGVNLLQENRAPRSINAENVIPDSEIHKIVFDLETANKNLCNIILPDRIAQNLSYFDHLIIAPCLNISTVPFYALKPFGNDKQLIDVITILITPSLTDIVKPEILGHNNAYVKWTWEKLISKPLIVGNPDFPPNDKWYLPPLPGAEEEVIQVGNLLSTKPLIGLAANKDSIIKNISNASIIYLATHGVISLKNPLSESYLAFSGKEPSESNLSFKEIQSIPMAASLAVLSACQTGLGQTHDSGVLSLTSGFHISGVPRIIMSLWNVDDHATKDLMVLFIDKLQFEDPSDALRHSMIEMREKYEDPKLWASFNLFGTRW